MTQINHQIKKMRELAGLTQTQAAQLVHIKLRQWQRYEAGDAAMPLAHLELFQLKTLYKNTLGIAPIK